MINCQIAIENILHADEAMLGKKLWEVANLINEIYLEFENLISQNKVLHSIELNWYFVDLEEEFRKYLNDNQEAYLRYKQACMEMYQIYDCYIPEIYFGFVNRKKGSSYHPPIAKILSFHFAKIEHSYYPLINQSSIPLSNLVLICCGLNVMAKELDCQALVLEKIQKSMKIHSDYPYL